MKQIRLGLLGIGKIARDQHIPALNANPAFALVACASRGNRVEGVANFPSLEAMLEGVPDIDAIAICTPPQVHYEAALVALQRGKHVLLEKPPCATTAQLDHLVQLAGQVRRSLFQTWHSRYAPAVDAARQWLASRDIRHVTITWKENVRQWHPGQTWLWQPGGFGVFDPGINALSILTAIVPQEVHVKSAQLAFPENCHAPIAADLLLASAGSAEIIAAFDFRQLGTQTWDIDVQTDDGPLKLSDGGTTLHIRGERMLGGANPEIGHEYAALYRRFAELIGRGESEVDARPFRLVADAFLVGTRSTVERFEP